MAASATYTQCDFIDPRIDVDAQFALFERMKRNDDGVSLKILGAVKAGLLGGVYQQDRRIPAYRALAYGQAWWTMFPSGKQAVMYPPRGLKPAKSTAPEVAAQPPILVYKKTLAGSHRALGDALAAAWKESVLATSTVVTPQPSGRPCPARPPPPPPYLPPPPGNAGGSPKPPPQVRIVSGVIPYSAFFEAASTGCSTLGMGLLYYCGLYNSSTALPGPKGVPIPIPGGATPSMSECDEVGVSGSWLPTAPAKIDKDKFAQWTKNCVKNSAMTMIIEALRAEAMANPGTGSRPFDSSAFEKELERWWAPSKVPATP